MSLPRLLPVAMLGALVVTVSACGNLESIHRTTGTQDDAYKLAFVDAKQRAIVVNKKSNSDLRICAEPSPDALASVAASFSGSLTGSSAASESLAAAVTNSLSGSAASIGLRTQSIQLMRDALYRLCEAHANGAINGFQMRSLQMRYQNMIIGLLAVEQLTGVVRAPAATTGGSAKAALANDSLETSKFLIELDGRRDTLRASLATQKLKRAEQSIAVGEAKKAVEAAKKAVEAAENDVNSDEGSDEDAVAAKEKVLEEAKAKSAQAESELTKINDFIEKMESKIGLLDKLIAANTEALSTLQTIGAATSAEANIFSASRSGSLAMDNDTADVISKAVSGIVYSVINQNNSLEACLEIFSRIADKQQSNQFTPSADFLAKIVEVCTTQINIDEKLMGTFFEQQLKN
ncbi:MAG: hypothetical protein P1U65_05130 [Minwuia sp.]|nr:hypothetical protein [Minwuia sp.]